MDRFLCACVSAVAVCVLLPANVMNGQTITIKEINPPNSSVGRNLASGGRVNHLARATNSIFYAASEYGGLFKSTDAGRTWTRLDTHLPTRVSDVKASPADPDLVIATSLYDGRVNSFAGINVSTDGGATWTKPVSSRPPTGFCIIAATVSEPSAYGISFDPDNAGHVSVGTNCGLARSTDGGATWAFINPGPAALATNVYGVVVHHGGIIDTCGSAGHRRSIDGGQTWNGPQAGGSPLPAGTCSIAASPDESSVLFATVGRDVIRETDNGGGSWNIGFANPAPQGRVPFVVTNNRQGRNFDLWFGDVELFRAACRTPATPGAGRRCPPSSTWVNVTKGAHPDMGEVVFTNPPGFSLTACRQDCTNLQTRCLKDCAEARDSCMAEVGEPGGRLASACVQELELCRSNCTTDLNACNTSCNGPQPEEAGCPAVLANDGGTYFNTLTESPACQTPIWTQPAVNTRALWLWSLGGANLPQSLIREALYMGTQDNGSFATLNAGAATPAWAHTSGGDVFDVVPDTTKVVSTVYCCQEPPGSYVLVRNPGDTGGGQIPNYPDGVIPGFKFPEVVARFDTNRYAMIMNRVNSVVSGSVFVTQDITKTPVVWTQLGNNIVAGCGLWAAGPPTNPTFYAFSAGACRSNSAGSLSRYEGTSTTGLWQRVTLPDFSQAGVFAVDPNNPKRLFVSQIVPGGVRMHRSSDGGVSWTPDPVLDGLMTGGGTFRMQVTIDPNDRYVQPTLVAFDPNNFNTLLAGAADAGIFLSRDNGASWTTVTNNSGDAANPVIPRPHWAYFDRECGQNNIYIGTQGRGAWRLSYPDPTGITVSTCQSRCEAPLQDCRSKCAALHAACLAETGPDKPLLFQCAASLGTCRSSCNNARNACRQRCVDCPQ
jgi:hypothetical protein